MRARDPYFSAPAEETRMEAANVMIAVVLSLVFIVGGAPVFYRYLLSVCRRQPRAEATYADAWLRRGVRDHFAGPSLTFGDGGCSEGGHLSAGGRGEGVRGGSLLVVGDTSGPRDLAVEEVAHLDAAPARMLTAQAVFARLLEMRDPESEAVGRVVAAAHAAGPEGAGVVLRLKASGGGGGPSAPKITRFSAAAERFRHRPRAGE